MHTLKLLAALAVASILTACSGTVQDRQASADQVFGTAKLSLVVASGLVSAYNLLPACTEGGPSPPLCWSESIADILNKSLEAGSSAIESSEAIFAAANSDEEARLKAAKVAVTVVNELVRNLQKFGVTKAKAG